MSSGRVTIQAFVDAHTFSEFAWFDLLFVQKRWRRPTLFAAFFAVIAAVAFSRAGHVEHASLLGGVLLAVGVGLPLAYFFGFCQSVRRQSAGLTGKEAAYTVTLDEQGVFVTKGKQSATCDWSGVHAAHRLKRCVCIYFDPHHAFLLPSGGNDRDVQKAWELLEAHLTPDRLSDHRRKESTSQRR